MDVAAVTEAEVDDDVDDVVFKDSSAGAIVDVVVDDDTILLLAGSRTMAFHSSSGTSYLNERV